MIDELIDKITACDCNPEEKAEAIGMALKIQDLIERPKQANKDPWEYVEISVPHSYSQVIKDSYRREGWILVEEERKEHRLDGLTTLKFKHLVE